MWSMADSYRVRPKKRPINKTDQKNTRIVGPMWLGILPDLPLFYLTCPVGPTLLGKTGKASCPQGNVNADALTSIATSTF